MRAQGLFFTLTLVEDTHKMQMCFTAVACESEHGLFLTGHSYPENVLHIFVVMTDLKVCVTCKYITHV
jgi:hypothetical protein